MAGGLKHINSRIKSIRNIRKITKAMEMVSVSKMKRAVDAVLRTRPYAGVCWSTLQDLADTVDQKQHPLLFANDEMKRILLVVINSDRGLCGSFNSEVLTRVDEFAKLRTEDIKIDYVTIGKKSHDAALRRSWNLVATFSHQSIVPTIADIHPIALLIKDEFLKGTYDHVFVVYTDFISTIKQRAVVHQLLPLHESNELGHAETNLKDGFQSNERSSEDGEAVTHEFEFKFEPKPDEVLDFILPRLIDVEIYQAILESIASEHSARMVAMKNASDAASDIVSDLTLRYNQMRQAAITNEIAEISAGKAVLEK